jgi:hypothetical protein
MANAANPLRLFVSGKLGTWFSRCELFSTRMGIEHGAEQLRPARRLDLNTRRLTDLIAVGSALAVFVIACSTYPVYSGMLSAIVFAAVSLLVPEWRINQRIPLSPANWAILVFGFQLVILPAIVSVCGPEIGSLPAMPSQQAIEAAQLLDTLAFLSFMAGYLLILRSRSSVTPSRAWAHHSQLVLPYLFIGLIGFAATFGTSLGTLFLSVDQHPTVSAIRGFIGAMCRPFAAFALLIFWTKKSQQLASAGRRVSADFLTAATGAGVVVIFATYGLGRNIFVVPLLSMIAAYGVRVRRVSLIALASAAVLLAAITVAAGAFRTVSRIDPPGISAGNSQQQLANAVHVSSNIQVYTEAPQFLAFVIEQTHWGRTLGWGSSLVSSFMYPIPELGKDYRDSSGAAIYNRWLYGRLPVRDQNLPVQAELFMNFHIPGVVLGFCLLGAVIALLHRRFLACGSTLQAYSLQFAAFWAAFLIAGNTTSVVYIAVTFCWPILVYAIVDRLSREQRSRPMRQSPF